MYILQDGKLYAQSGDKLVGVNIGLDKVVKVKETAKLGDNFQILTPSEVRAKYNIKEGGSYTFPVKATETKKKTEVVKDEPTSTPKKPTRKSTRK